ncbi:MAG: SDR family NAD(P)-dependent oxidoreductase [Gammaproteobacteria bacterium]|nr:SDR family NAD(P)-dependent oxidoreductase [Gammaproteobacteria bacterium]
MKNVVITGGTRGIGRGLAAEFLKRACNVAITGRNQDAVDTALTTLGQTPSRARRLGFVAELSDFNSLQAVWDGAKQGFGSVDVWINNAGMSLPNKPLHEQDAEDLKSIVETNLTGILYANKIAIAGMRELGAGQVWNMEGFGSDGRTQIGIASYGATKRAVNYLNKALKKEVEGSGVQVCALSPGIVVTDLLIGDYDRASKEWERAKKIFNILGDKVETVTPFLADGILNSNRNGARVAWLTTGKALKRFMTAGFNKRDLFTGV